MLTHLYNGVKEEFPVGQTLLSGTILFGQTGVSGLHAYAKTKVTASRN